MERPAGHPLGGAVCLRSRRHVPPGQRRARPDPGRGAQRPPRRRSRG
jgi:hypothetical protein